MQNGLVMVGAPEIPRTWETLFYQALSQPESQFSYLVNAGDGLIALATWQGSSSTLAPFRPRHVQARSYVQASGRP